ALPGGGLLSAASSTNPAANPHPELGCGGIFKRNSRHVTSASSSAAPAIAMRGCVFNLQPARFLEPQVQIDIETQHYQQRKGVAVVPFQFRHVLEIHAVNAGN